MPLISGHLTRLFDFTGRENRQPFWLWVLVTYGAQTVLGFVLMVPMSIGMGSRMEALQRYDQAYLDAHPEVASQVMMEAMQPFFRFFILFVVAVTLVYVLLLAAATVRRLHDTDRSGWWAMPVAVLQFVTLVSYALVFQRFFAAIGRLGPDASAEAGNAAMAALMPVFALAMLCGLVGFVFMIILIIFLASRGTIGPNRYGPDLLPPPPVYPYPPQQWQPAPPPALEPSARVVGPWGPPPPGT